MNIDIKERKQISRYDLYSICTSLALFFYLYYSLFLTNLSTDGICYALIARNLTQGLGSLWQPAYSLTQHIPFYEHPSLGLIFESFFFRVLGDHVYTEHVYSFGVATANLILLYAFWRKFYIEKEKMAPPRNYVWMIIGCWFLVPYFVYYYIGGGLEMQANLFAFLAVYLLLLSTNNAYSIMTTLIIVGAAALLVFISFMINGPLTLFPLVFYALHWFVYRKFSISYYFCLTIVLIGLCVICGSVFFGLFPNAYVNFTHYFQQGVMNALLANRYDAKLSGMEQMKMIIIFLPQLKYLFLLSFALILVHYRKGKVHCSEMLSQHLFENKEAGFCLLIAMSATLPIIISAKQFIYYSLQGGFFFLLSFLLFLVPAITSYMKDEVLTKKHSQPWLAGFFIIMVTTMFVMHQWSVEVANNAYDIITEKFSPYSSRLSLSDAKAIAKHVPKKGIISYSLLNSSSIPEPIGNNLMRFYQISLDTFEGALYSLALKGAYLTIPSYRHEYDTVINKYGYKKIDVELNNFYLYKKIKP